MTTYRVQYEGNDYNEQPVSGSFDFEVSILTTWRKAANIAMERINAEGVAYCSLLQFERVE